MLRVKTYLDRSSIQGIGVFANEDIPCGTVVWEFNPAIDRQITSYEQLTLHMYGHELDKAYMKKYAYLDKQTDRLILSGDNDRFTNHSNNPNTRPNDAGNMIAVRDIKINEEITANYYDIDKFADEKLQLSLF